MAGKGRIPQKLSLFNLYILRFVKWLITIKIGQTDTNAVRNGVTVTEVSAFQTILGKWHSEDPDTPGVYDLHTDPETKTKITGVKVRSVKKEFSDKARPVLDRVSGSINIVDEDLELLNIAKKGGPHSQHNAPITASTYIRHKILGPAKIKLSCYAAEDSNRPSINKAAGANSIQYAFCIYDPNYKTTEPEQSGIVRATRVTSADECVYREIHTRATDVFDFPLKYRKFDIYIYARQYYISNPKIAGPWCEVLMFSIP